MVPSPQFLTLRPEPSISRGYSKRPATLLPSSPFRSTPPSWHRPKLFRPAPSPLSTSSQLFSKTNADDAAAWLWGYLVDAKEAALTFQPPGGSVPAQAVQVAIAPPRASIPHLTLPRCDPPAWSETLSLTKNFEHLKEYRDIMSIPNPQFTYLIRQALPTHLQTITNSLNAADRSDPVQLEAALVAQTPDDCHRLQKEARHRLDHLRLLQGPGPGAHLVKYADKLYAAAVQLKDNGGEDFLATGGSALSARFVDGLSLEYKRGGWVTAALMTTTGTFRPWPEVRLAAQRQDNLELDLLPHETPPPSPFPSAFAATPGPAPHFKPGCWKCGLVGQHASGCPKKNGRTFGSQLPSDETRVGRAPGNCPNHPHLSRVSHNADECQLSEVRNKEKQCASSSPESPARTSRSTPTFGDPPLSPRSGHYAATSFSTHALLPGPDHSEPGDTFFTAAPGAY